MILQSLGGQFFDADPHLKDRAEMIGLLIAAECKAFDRGRGTEAALYCHMQSHQPRFEGARELGRVLNNLWGLMGVVEVD